MNEQRKIIAFLFYCFAMIGAGFILSQIVSEIKRIIKKIREKIWKK